ncbi:hypothetical protein BLNAU_9035 [Blattamonas nauphoetae]|uniref:Uncharacterized protein n=1 Tax=Blattamonas nauphoetae TaxID=2049346 RepID=A0ABQ9XX49_9EUKA|nr:hypothetical protein BLNAU_9035 [Blattamonas nauphoetae]
MTQQDHSYLNLDEKLQETQNERSSLFHSLVEFVRNEGQSSNVRLHNANEILQNLHPSYAEPVIVEEHVKGLFPDSSRPFDDFVESLGKFISDIYIPLSVVRSYPEIQNTRVLSGLMVHLTKHLMGWDHQAKDALQVRKDAVRSILDEGLRDALEQQIRSDKLQPIYNLEMLCGNLTASHSFFIVLHSTQILTSLHPTGFTAIVLCFSRTRIHRTGMFLSSRLALFSLDNRHSQNQNQTASSSDSQIQIRNSFYSPMIASLLQNPDFLQMFTGSQKLTDQETTSQSSASLDTNSSYETKKPVQFVTSADLLTRLFTLPLISLVEKTEQEKEEANRMEKRRRQSRVRKERVRARNRILHTRQTSGDDWSSADDNLSSLDFSSESLEDSDDAESGEPCLPFPSLDPTTNLPDGTTSHTSSHDHRRESKWICGHPVLCVRIFRRGNVIILDENADSGLSETTFSQTPSLTSSPNPNGKILHHNRRPDGTTVDEEIEPPKTRKTDNPRFQIDSSGRIEILQRPGANPYQSSKTFPESTAITSKVHSTVTVRSKESDTEEGSQSEDKSKPSQVTSVVYPSRIDTPAGSDSVNSTPKIFRGNSPYHPHASSVAIPISSKTPTKQRVESLSQPLHENTGECKTEEKGFGSMSTISAKENDRKETKKLGKIDKSDQSEEQQNQSKTDQKEKMSSSETESLYRVNLPISTAQLQLPHSSPAASLRDQSQPSAQNTLKVQQIPLSTNTLSITPLGTTPLSTTSSLTESPAAKSGKQPLLKVNDSARFVPKQKGSVASLPPLPAVIPTHNSPSTSIPLNNSTSPNTHLAETGWGNTTTEKLSVTAKSFVPRFSSAAHKNPPATDSNLSPPTTHQPPLPAPKLKSKPKSLLPKPKDFHSVPKCVEQLPRNKTTMGASSNSPTQTNIFTPKAEKLSSIPVFTSKTLPTTPSLSFPKPKQPIPPSFIPNSSVPPAFVPHNPSIARPSPAIPPQAVSPPFMSTPAYSQPIASPFTPFPSAPTLFGSIADEAPLVVISSDGNDTTTELFVSDGKEFERSAKSPSFLSEVSESKSHSLVTFGLSPNETLSFRTDLSPPLTPPSTHSPTFVNPVLSPPNYQLLPSGTPDMQGSSGLTLLEKNFWSDWNFGSVGERDGPLMSLDSLQPHLSSSQIDDEPFGSSIAQPSFTLLDQHAPSNLEEKFFFRTAVPDLSPNQRSLSSPFSNSLIAPFGDYDRLALRVRSPSPAAPTHSVVTPPPDTPTPSQPAPVTTTATTTTTPTHPTPLVNAVVPFQTKSDLTLQHSSAFTVSPLVSLSQNVLPVFKRTLLWEIEGMSLLIGSNQNVFTRGITKPTRGDALGRVYEKEGREQDPKTLELRTGKEPKSTISVKLIDVNSNHNAFATLFSAFSEKRMVNENLHQETNKLTAELLSLFVENVLNGIQTTVFCFHSSGVVEEYLPVDTDEIPTIHSRLLERIRGLHTDASNSPRSPSSLLDQPTVSTNGVIEQGVQLLEQLERRCSSEDGVYWLVMMKGSSEVRLVDQHEMATLQQQRQRIQREERKKKQHKAKGKSTRKGLESVE